MVIGGMRRGTIQVVVPGPLRASGRVDAAGVFSGDVLEDGGHGEAGESREEGGMRRRMGDMKHEEA